MLGIFARLGAKTNNDFSKGGYHLNALYFCLILAIVLAVIIFICGIKKAKTGIMVLAFVLLAAVTLATLFSQGMKTTSYDYRVVYFKDSIIVTVDDNNGATKRFNLNEVAHAEVDFAVNTQVTVVTSSLGKPVFIAPSDAVAPDSQASNDGVHE